MDDQSSELSVKEGSSLLLYDCDRRNPTACNLASAIPLRRRSILTSLAGGVAMCLTGCWPPDGYRPVGPAGFDAPKLLSDGLGIVISDAIFAKILATIRSQRPSLLNYASPYFVSHPADFPHPVPIPANGAPIATGIGAIKFFKNPRVPPIELVAQINDVAVSFGRNNVDLPQALLPLAPNALAVRLYFSARTRTARLDETTLGFPDDPDQFANAKFEHVLSPSFPIELFLVLSTRLLSHGDTIWLAYSINGFANSLLQPTQLADAVNQIVVLLADTVFLPTAWARIDSGNIDLTSLTDATSPYRSLCIVPKLGESSPDPTATAGQLFISLSLEVKPT